MVPAAQCFRPGNAMRFSIACLLILHTILGCCFHHLSSQDDCPQICACAGDVAVSDNCECSHHPHDGHSEVCSAEDCNFTKTENPRDVKAYSPSTSPGIHSAELYSRDSCFYAIAHSAVREPISIRKHILLEIFLV